MSTESTDPTVETFDAGINEYMAGVFDAVANTKINSAPEAISIMQEYVMAAAGTLKAVYFMVEDMKKAVIDAEKGRVEQVIAEFKKSGDIF